MKIIKPFIYSFILISLFSVSAISQTVNSKIAAVNTEAFKDRLFGIKEFIEANDKLEAEFKPQVYELNLIAEKAMKLYKEIKELQAFSNKNPYFGAHTPFSEKVEEFKNLNVEYKEKDEQRKLMYAKRKSEIFINIENKIFDAVAIFEKQNGFLIILESSKKINYALIETEPINVTQKFIEFYNKNTPKIRRKRDREEA